MKVCGDVLGVELIIVRDETEAPRMACLTVAHDDAVRDGAELAKVISKALLVGLPGETADEDFFVGCRGGGGGRQGICGACHLW